MRKTIARRATINNRQEKSPEHMLRALNKWRNGRPPSMCPIYTNHIAQLKLYLYILQIFVRFITIPS